MAGGFWTGSVEGEDVGSDGGDGDPEGFGVGSGGGGGRCGKHARVASRRVPHAFCYKDEAAGTLIRTLHVGAGTGLSSILLDSKPCRHFIGRAGVNPQMVVGPSIGLAVEIL
jgi:hypothetical protein